MNRFYPNKGDEIIKRRIEEIKKLLLQREEDESYHRVFLGITLAEDIYDLIKNLDPKNISKANRYLCKLLRVDERGLMRLYKNFKPKIYEAIEQYKRLLFF